MPAERTAIRHMSDVLQTNIKTGFAAMPLAEDENVIQRSRRDASCEPAGSNCGNEPVHSLLRRSEALMPLTMHSSTFDLLPDSNSKHFVKPTA